MNSNHSLSKLIVTNFGPIHRANIELCPLSVFVGQSNTGKSYLATLIYVLHKFFHHLRSQLWYGLHTKFDSLLQSGSNDEINRWSASLAQTANHLYDFKTDRSTSQHEIGLSDPLGTYFKSMISNLDTALLEEEIVRCFGLPLDDLCPMNGESNPHIVIHHVTDESDHDVEFQFLLQSGNIESSTTIPDEMIVKLRGDNINASHIFSFLAEPEDYLEPDGSAINIRGSRLLSAISPYISANIWEPFAGYAYYVPSERTGMMRVLNAIVGGMIGHSAMDGIRPSPHMDELTGVMTDFLEVFTSLDAPQSNPHLHQAEKSSNQLQNICARMEGKILKGTILTRNSEITNIPQFVYQPRESGNPLPLKNASSTVSELAPILLYLRHKARSGDILIIEEPESHLHPEVQVQLTLEIAAIVNAGIRVIVTTHSEWILEELANLVNLSSLDKEDRVKIDENDEALDPKDVGVFLFQEEEQANGSTVKRIDLDESSLYPSGYDEVATALYNKSARIFNKREG